MKICITGASGLVGSHLRQELESHGHETVPMVRSRSAAKNAIYWNPDSGEIDKESLVGMDALVHLAAESIAEGRWTTAKKERIRASRVQGTRLISETLAKLDGGPKVFASASAIGFYGDRGDEELTEDSAAGRGFLAEVCREWEAATASAANAGIRTTNLRFGIILSSDGGALKKMLTPFRLGVGGVIGNGRQLMSWISIDDVASAIRYVIEHEAFRGPVNVVSPNPVTNREFTKTLGAVLHRPTLFPLPKFAAKLVLGEMADELLLASTRVVPKRLLDQGFVFQHPELKQALDHILAS